MITGKEYSGRRMALTAKQESACQAFVLSKNPDVKGNKSGAYREAYNTSKMKPVSVNRVAKRLFDQVNIRSRVEELQNKIKSALIADEIELQEFWTSVMRGEEVVEATTTEEGVDIEVKPEVKDRLKSSELLGKTKMMFVEKKIVEITNPADELERLKALATHADK